jgi:hypothetical protein
MASALVDIEGTRKELGNKIAASTNPCCIGQAFVSVYYLANPCCIGRVFGLLRSTNPCCIGHVVRRVYFTGE